MTPAELVTVVAETAQALVQTESGRGFVKSIDKIVDALSRVPDYSSTAFCREEIAGLQRAAEQAITAIEVRIETGDDKGTDQLKLARAIYELRRELEAIDRWRQHYL